MRRALILLVILIALVACVPPTAPEITTVTAEPEPESEPEPPRNRVPTVELHDATVTIGQAMTLTADGYDPDGDLLTYTWTGAVIAEGEVVEWTPIDEGEFPVHVVACDGDLTAEASAMITVEPPPWTPEPLHVYILDANDEVYIWELCTADNYASRLQAYRLSVDLWNRDGYPGGPFTAVGGGYP